MLLLTATIYKFSISLRNYVHLVAFAGMSLPVLVTVSITSSESGTVKGSASGKRDELRDASNAIRALCLRSFPELLADIKTAALPRGELGTGVAEITQQVYS